MALALPFGGFAAEADQARGFAPTEAGLNGTARPVQLAAAIGIVKPESSEPAVPPAEPPAATPPAPAPRIESAAAEEPAEEADASGSSRSKTILIGAGVAALLGALAGGGGGGGGSSTPGH